MPVPASGQTIDGVVEGLLTMNATLFGLAADPVQDVWSGTVNGNPAVMYEGDPGAYQPEVLIAVAYDGLTGTPIQQAITRPTLGTNRSREIAVEVKTLYSVQQLGDESARRVARQAVDAMTEQVSLYFRVPPQEILSNSCREAFVTGIDGPRVSTSFDPNTGLVTGFFAESVVTITAFIRN